MTAPITTSNADPDVPMWGIIAVGGDFWTPVPFLSEADARQHVADFWGRDIASRDECLRRFRFVPVRVEMTALAQPEATATRGE